MCCIDVDASSRALCSRVLLFGCDCHTFFLRVLLYCAGPRLSFSLLTTGVRFSRFFDCLDCVSGVCTLAYLSWVLTLACGVFV